MRTSKTLAKLRAGDTARVCSLGHFIPHYLRQAAHFGFDCIWLDMEHRCLSDRDVQSLLAFGHLAKIDVMVRPQTLEKTRLYRHLEDGAAGLMIPHVSTPEMAQMLVESVRFPPVGNRGLDGVGLDADFGCGDFDYPAMANQQTFLVVQIETVEAVENAEAIAAVDGVDVLFVGTGDLGLRLKHHDGSLTIDAACERVADACQKHGRAWGCPAGTGEDLAKRQAQGARFMAHGGEFHAIRTMLQSAAAVFDEHPPVEQ